MLYGAGNDRTVAELMTPIEKCACTKRMNISSTKEAADELEKFDADKLVWLDENYNIRGLITMKDIAKSLQGLPPVKMHCATMTTQGLDRAIKDYNHRKKIKKDKK